MIIYVNSNDFKCYTSKHDDTFLGIETDFFDGKCEAYIEGYRYIPFGKSWIRSDGVVFNGEMIAPWKPYDELASAQQEHERNLLAEYKAELAVLDAALLDAQYNMLIGGL